MTPQLLSGNQPPLRATLCVNFRRMLGTFLKDFSQVGTSQGYFPTWQLPKCAISRVATSQMCNFPSGNLPNVQFPKWQLPKPVLAAALGSLAHPSRSARPPPIAACGASEGLT